MSNTFNHDFDFDVDQITECKIFPNIMAKNDRIAVLVLIIMM